MVCLLTSAEHTYTWDEVAERCPAAHPHTLSYDAAFANPPATTEAIIFGDLDRLPAWRLGAAAKLYRRLRNAGARVLNDPARHQSRFGLLRALQRAGLNSFNAYRVDEGRTPERWPVFLRCEGDHDMPVSGLIETPEALARAVETAVDAGAPRSAMLMIEFAAEPVAPGLWRGLTVFRVGETLVSGFCVHDDQWIVKTGQRGIATPELYADDLRIVQDNPFGDALRPVFELAACEYGELNFGLVGGRPQSYEINLNPEVAFGTDDHPSADRLEAYRTFRRNFAEALARLDP